MTPEKIQHFLSDRPAISVTMLCKEAGITKRYLDYILNDERPLTDEVVSKLKPVMKKYGWQGV